MEETTLRTQRPDAAPVRKPWREPAIILERALEVAAQGGVPGRPGEQPSYLGPLAGSGGTVGGCL